MAKEYRQRPSAILGVYDDYCAYCFDEACVYLYDALKQGKKLHFKGDKEKAKTIKHFKSIGEFYKSLEVQ